MQIFDGVSRNPLYLQVAESIREAIIAGTLSPGDALPTERDLSESFGVSRASVREALRALQAQGLVVVDRLTVAHGGRRGRGAHARDAMVTLLRLNGVGVDDLMEFRSQLEGGALAAAARAARRGAPGAGAGGARSTCAARGSGWRSSRRPTCASTWRWCGRPATRRCTW